MAIPTNSCPSTWTRGTSWSFEYNAECTVRAEELGFDLVFGLAQWLGKGGYGGDMRFREHATDPLLVTAALAPLTRNIILISTVHILYGWHPLHLAKFAASIDHMSQGRWGLNVVTGYKTSEYEMFGITPIAHDLRYEMADEFSVLLRRLWTEDENLTVEKLTSDTSPVIRLVDSTIFTAIQRRASDIHIETQDDAVHVKYRIDGVLQPAMRPIAKQFHTSIISRIKVMSELDIAEKRVPQDGRFKVRVPGKSIDFRVSIMPSVHGEDAVIRILDKESISEQFSELRLDILGFPDSELKRFRKYIAEPYGMVLVTGPTGSGKTTTLYSALKAVAGPDVNVTTIEDPIEMVWDGFNQVQVQPKVGLDFANALRSILRQDPDVIMVGEIRDAETGIVAAEAALTGNLVLSTMLSGDAIGAIPRLINLGIPPYWIASTLVGVIHQQLPADVEGAVGVGPKFAAPLRQPQDRKDGRPSFRMAGQDQRDIVLFFADGEREYLLTQRLQALRQ